MDAAAVRTPSSPLKHPVNSGAAPSPPKPVDGRLLSLLVVVPMLVYVFSGPTFLGYDGNIMLRVTESLLFKHSLQITDPMLHFNEPYAYFGLGVSLLLIPFVAIGHGLFGNDTLLVNLFEPLVTAATIGTLWLLLRELGVGRRRALWIAWLYAFGTLAWHYAGVLFIEPLVALCLTVAMLALVRFRNSSQRAALVIAGSAVGIAVVARIDSTLLIALPTFLYAMAVVVRRQRAQVAARRQPQWWHVGLPLALFSAPVVLAVVVDAWYDWIRYGSPFKTGYAAYDALGFTYPLIKGIYGLLLSPGVGLFVFVPVLVVALLGFSDFRRRWPLEFALVAVVVCGRVLFYAGWWSWDGGLAWGPRFLVPILPLVMIGLAFLPVRGWRRVGLWLTGSLSVGIELLGQLVWFGTWFDRTAIALAPRVDLPACGSCGESTILGVQRLKEIMDFDWQYSPLIGQLRLLLEGAAHPAWAPVAWLAPFLLAGIVACGWYQWRLAGVDDTRADRIRQVA
jgi:hypothetical protein